MLREKNIILAARILSMLFTPFYLPMVGLIILFIFTYMAILPLGYKLYMLMFIYMFTVLMPSLLIHLYRKFQGWSPIELGHKERRIVPYIISILCYCGCFFYLEYRHVPRVLSIVLIAALLVCSSPLFWCRWHALSSIYGGRYPRIQRLSAVWQEHYWPTLKDSLSTPHGGSA